METNNGKINKSFKITYIISCILLGIVLILETSNIFSDSLLLELQILIPLGLFYFSLLINFICGIINFIKNKDKKVRRKLAFLFIILLVMGILVQIIPSTIRTIIRNNKQEELTEQMNNIGKSVIKNIKNDNENNYIYLYTDLKELDNSLDLSDGSYATYFDDKVYVCLNNGNNTIKGYEDDLKISKEECSPYYWQGYACDYDYAHLSDGDDYLKHFLEEKYNISIKEVDTITDFTLFCNSLSGYEVIMPFGTFKADVEVIDGKIVVTDGYEEYNSSLTQNEKNVIAVEEYTKKHLGVDEITMDTDIYDVYFSEEGNYISIGSSYNEDDAKKYAEALAQYLQTLNKETNIIIKKVVRIESDECIDSICSNNIVAEYIISFSIVNGEVTWY